MLAESRPLMAPAETVLLGVRCIRVFCDCPALLPAPAPRLATGLTPLLTRQVGVVGDGVPFCSTARKPRQAMLCASKIPGQRAKWGPLPAQQQAGSKAQEAEQGEDETSVCDVKCEPCPLPMCCKIWENDIHSPESAETPVSSESTGEAEVSASVAELGRQTERMLVPDLPPVTPGVSIEPATSPRLPPTPPPSLALFSPWDRPGSEVAGCAPMQLSATATATVPATAPASSAASETSLPSAALDRTRSVGFLVQAATVVKDIIPKLEDATRLEKVGEVKEAAALGEVKSNEPLRDVKSDSHAKTSLRTIEDRVKALLRPAAAASEPVSAPASCERPADLLLLLASSDSERSLALPAVRVIPHRLRTPPPPCPASQEPWATAVLSHVWDAPPTSSWLSIAANRMAKPRHRSSKKSRTSQKKRSKSKKRTMTVDPEWSKWDFDSSSSEDLEVEEPLSPPPATPMDITREVEARAVADVEGDGEGKGGARRCETLQWARGEQLHPHCAFIAFPNDTDQRSLRPWPSNRLTRSIFTGAARFAGPPWAKETWTPAEVLARHARADASRRALRQQERTLRLRAIAAARSRAPPPEYDVSNPRLYDFLGFRPSTISTPEPVEPPLPAIENRDALVPLTPSQLINVRLVPSLIDFGTVGIGSRVSASVQVRNDNAVLVKLNVSAQSLQLVVGGGGVLYVPPHQKGSVKIWLKSNTVGHFNGTLRYVVNDCHALEAAATAEVVVRALRLQAEALFFGFVRGFEEAWPKTVDVVPIHNPLQVPCRFEWVAVDKTCYDVLPRAGVVPALGACACEVTYRVNTEAQSPDAKLVLNTEGDGSLQLSCTLLAPSDSRPPNAGWVRPFMQLPTLGVQGRRRFVLQVFNASHLETLFRVLDSKETVDGMEEDVPRDAGTKSRSSANRIMWRVRPTQGVLRPRCIRNLHLTVRACVAGRATFRVRMALGALALAPSSSAGPRSSFGQYTPGRRWGKVAVQTLSAEVVYPALEAEPTELRFWRVPAGARVSKPFRVRNVGGTELWLGVATGGPGGGGAEIMSASGEWALSTRADRVVPMPLPLVIPARAPPVELHLHFRPVDVASYQFVLPLTVNGVAAAGPLRGQGRRNSSLGGTPIFREKMGSSAISGVPSVYVEATVSRRVLSFSETEFSFVYNTCDRSKNVTEHQVYVECARSDGVFFWLWRRPPGGAPFRVTPLAASNATTTVNPAASASASATDNSIPPARGPSSGGRILAFSKLSQDGLREHLQSLADVRRTRVSADWADALSSISLSSFPSMMRLPSLQPSRIFTIDRDLQQEEDDDDDDGAPAAVQDDADDDDDEEMVVLCCTLRPGDVCAFGLVLEPRAPGEFKVEVPVFAGGMGKDDMPVANLSLHAVCRGHTLSLPVDELFLPPRPLNVPSEAKLSLTVEHEDDFDISWALEDLRVGRGRYTQACLNVSVLKQRVAVRPHVSRVPLSVGYKSPTPLGLRARVVFTLTRRGGSAAEDDAFGRSTCALRVTALSDVSLFSTHFFARVRHPRFAQGPPPPPGRAAPAAAIAGPRSSCSRRSSRARSIVRGATLYSDEDLHDGENSLDEEEDEVHELSKQKSETRRSGARGGASVPSIPLAQAASNSRTSLQSEPPSPHVARTSGVSAVTKTDSQASLGAPAGGRLSMQSGMTGAEEEQQAPEERGAAARRHRGLSRCASDFAVVDADLDSLVSSEDSDVSNSGAIATEPPSAHKETSDSPHCSFPAFPDPGDVSEYAIYMRRVQQAAEEWLFDVVMQHDYWITIPYGFNELYRMGSAPPTAWESPAERRRKGDVPPCPFDLYTAFTVFVNLAGKTAVDFIQKCMVPMKEDDWVYGEGDAIIPGMTLEGETAEVSKHMGDPALRALARIKLRKCALLLHTIRCSGGVLPHVRPEFLLDYNMYKELVLACDTESSGSVTGGGEWWLPWNDMGVESEAAQWGREEGEAGAKERGRRPMVVRPLDVGAHVRGPLLSPRRHHQLNRQAWLDVVLQSARVFWMPKIDEEHRRALESVQTDDEKAHAEQGELQFRSRQYYVASAAHYSEHELCLLAWLNERYAHARATACARIGSPHQRHIGNFESDLADGVVLAYVTLDVCPYCHVYMPDIYPAPTKIEEAMHNAARLVFAWRSLHLGFTVSVRDLVQPLALKMVLLVAFLYNVLPALSGRAPLLLSAPLGTRAVAPLTLVNPSPYRLHYLAEFIGDVSDCFKVLVDAATAPKPGVEMAGVTFSLAPSQHTTLRVGFHANTLQPRSCTLLLSGTMQAPKFGRSLALRLEGRASSLDVSATVEIHTTLYQVTDHRLLLPVPELASSDGPAASHRQTTHFDLYLKHSVPTVDEPFTGCAWSQLRGRRVLRRLFLNQGAVEVAGGEGAAAGGAESSRVSSSLPWRHKPQPRAALSVTVCSLTPNTRTFWVGCVSACEGDFIVKVVTRVARVPPLGVLSFRLPSGWQRARCTCGGRFLEHGGDHDKCPLSTHVDVPCANGPLQRAAHAMFKKTLNSFDLDFWREHLESSIGTQLMQLELVKDDELVDEYAHIFNNSVTYSVSLTPNTVTVPEHFRIPDVHAPGSVSLPLHVSAEARAQHQWRLRLQSEDGREVREYSLRTLQRPRAGTARKSPAAPPNSARTKSTRRSQIMRVARHTRTGSANQRPRAARNAPAAPTG